jgi:hypothetical protein
MAPRKPPTEKPVNVEALPVEKGVPVRVASVDQAQSSCCKAELYPVYVGLADVAYKCSECGRMQDPREIGLA